MRSMKGMMIESMPEYEIVDDNSKTVHSPTDNRPDMNPKGQDVNKDGIKIISTDEKTKIHLIDDPQHGRCSISFDGLVRYNYDVTRIIHVDKNITSFTIPGSVTSIDNRVFSGCTSLSSIVIPDSVTSIGEYAFSYCRSLKSITIPDSVTEIGDFAFSNCTSLKEITLSASLSTIKKHTFFGCKPKTVGVPAQLNIDSIFPAETKFWIRKTGHGKK